MKTKEQEDYYLGYRFLTSLFKIIPLFYPSFEWCIFLTALLFAVAGSNEYVTYHSGTIVGKFYNAFIAHDEHMFWNVFWKASLICVGQTLLIAIINLISWILSLSMRKNLVTSLHSLYFDKNAYYNINCINDDGIDNPDQRITQDAEKMTSLLAKNILPYLLISPGVIAYYTYKTWTQAGPIGVGCIYAYFLIGTIVNRIIVSPITKWSAKVEKSEGDFRYKHVNVRDNAEESAFYGANEYEKEESDRFLLILLKNQLKLVLWKFPPQYFQLFFDYYGGVLSYVIQAIPIFALNSYKGDDPETLSEQISNNAFFFMYLINSFTRLTDLAMNIGEMAGYTQRIAALIDSVKENDGSYRGKTAVLSGSQDEDKIFTAQNLVCYPPNDNKRCIINGISFNFLLSKPTLITGVSGVGKTSLLRLLRQLWIPYGGTLERFISYDKVVFLPQNSYLPAGRLSLAQQLLFPNNKDDIDESRIISVLESLCLSRLLVLAGNLKDEVNFEWSEVLSPGEQQRLSIARVLLKRPKVVILDESTSGLSEDMEETVYNLLKKNEIHYISVGHRTSLLRFHTTQLRIKGVGVWELQAIEEHQKI